MRKKLTVVACLAVMHGLITWGISKWDVRLHVDDFFRHPNPIPRLHTFVHRLDMALGLPFFLLQDYLPVEWHPVDFYCMSAANSVLWAVFLYGFWIYCRRGPNNSVQPTASRSAAGGG